MHRLIAIGAISLALCGLPLLSQANSVTEYQLKNGMKVLVKEDHRAPIVVSQIWYKVGASYEPNGITGVSHELEHMMFKGTKKHSIRRIPENNCCKWWS